MRSPSILVILVIIAGATLSGRQASGQDMKESINAQFTIRADQPGGIIHRDIYGHFAEHLGRCIYEGMWVGEDSKIPNTRGIRNDVLEALKKLDIPVLRWPGGCFADEYHWRDGIGPRDKRPKRINTHWGMVIENNHFGTHEFLELCDLLGAEAYISGNVGSGTPQEMMEWVEYMTSDSDSTLANERRANGRKEPWKIKYFGVGNENWGCGGNMRPEYYADLYRRYQTFVKNYPGSRIQKIACGSNGEDYNWTEVVMSRVNPRMMSGISLHWYTLPTGNWQKKGPATGFPVEQWDGAMVRAARMDELITKHLAIMDKHDRDKRVGLVVDEWGTWYDQEPGSKPGFLYQQNSIRDAIVAGLTLNIFHQHCDRVTMANIAQTVNVLQAMILTDQEKMILTPTYHAFEMYKVHQGATLLPTERAAGAGDYEVEGRKLDSVSLSASKDESGKIHLSLVNTRHDRPANVSIKLTGAAPHKAAGRILTAEKIDAHNTFDQPEAVKPAPFEGTEINEGQLSLTLPAKSVVVLELQ